MSNLPDLDSIAVSLRASPSSLSLRLLPATPSEPFGDALRELGREIARVSRGAISFVETDPVAEAETPTTPERPALLLCREGEGEVRYLAFPTGPEAAPFLEALVGGGASGPSRSHRTLSHPAELTVFVAEACPHCPHAVRAALELAKGGVVVNVVDAQRFGELAARWGVRSAPTTILDGEVIWTGTVPATELAEVIAERGSEAYERRVLGSMVETGRFDAAEDRILAEGGASRFFALWRESTTSSRIGLLLVAERVLAREGGAFDPVLAELLVELTATDDDPLRGDTADLLGRVDRPAARAALEKLLDDPHPDVREIASDALGLDE